MNPFEFHGVTTKKTGNQLVADCIFCGADQRFFINPETSQWDCKVCHEKGNLYTFLQRLLDNSDSSDESLQYLSESRNIELETLRQWGICLSPYTDEYLIPTYNAEGKLSNLYVYRTFEEGGKSIVAGTPSINQQLFTLKTLDFTKVETTYICSGPWDTMKWYECLSKLKIQKVSKDKSLVVKTNNSEESLLNNCVIVGVPGEGQWKDHWTDRLFNHRSKPQPIILFDNDHPRKPNGKEIIPGWDATKTTVAKIDIPSKCLKWGEHGYTKDLKGGYDISNLLDDNSLQRSYQLVQSRLVTLKPKEKKEKEQESTIEPKECISFKNLYNQWEANGYHQTENQKICLAVCLAVSVSTHIPGDQLWFRIIGPPSSGKSTLVETLSVARKYVKPLSIVRGFHSGFVGNRRQASKDSSLIPMIDGKTLVVKDADTILSSPSRDTILAEARDIYDRTSRSQYRNRKGQDYEDFNCTMLWCGTDDLRSLNRTSLGERFLDCEIHDRNDDKLLIQSSVNRTLSLIKNYRPSNNGKKKEGSEIQAYTYGYLNYLHNNIEPLIQSIKISDQCLPKIQAMGTYLSFVRSKQIKDKESHEWRTRREVAARPTNQLLKLSICLAIVLNKKSVDKGVLDMVRKVVIDSGTGYQEEILKSIYQAKRGLTIQQICTGMSLGLTHARNVTNNMIELEMIKKGATRKNGTGTQGRDSHVFFLTPEMKALCKVVYG